MIRDSCILCGKLGDKIILNDLAMRLCVNCGLVWLYQGTDTKVYYERDYHVNLDKESLLSRLQNAKARLRDLGKFIPKDNLCDVGAGEGAFVQILISSGWKDVVGVEPNPDFVSFAKSKGLPIYQGTIESMPDEVTKYSISTYTLFHVIEHLQDPSEALKKIFDKLPAGGTLVIETPNINAYSIRKSNFRHELIYKEHLFYFNQKNLILILEKAGFKNISIIKRDFDPQGRSIRESLRKLGIIPYNNDKSSKITQNIATAKKGDTTSNHNIWAGSRLLRVCLRRVLAYIVHVLGREDYMMAIAYK